MQSTKRFLLLTSCAFCIALTQTARADYFGLEVVERTDLPICKDQTEPDIPYKLDVCEVYVVFDNPADRLISTALCDVSTTDPAGFYQHTLGGNHAPACAFIPLFPTLVCDSFVTLGLECDRGGSTTDPDFDSTAFNTAGEVRGGWYNSAPSNGQGVPDANGRVLIGRFSYKQNKTSSWDVCIFTQIGGSGGDIIEFMLVPFDCAVPGGGLPAVAEDPTFCGDPLAGGCFEFISGTPFCNCAECCNAVCELASICCDEGWDSLCSNYACEICDPLACDDCNNNGIFDACEADCNPPGVCVDCTAGLGCGTISPDCNLNNVPDDCDIDPTDPDNNGVVSADSNSNGIPDECEDCNGNGILDPCDLDCGVPGGFCDVTGCGLSADCNTNGIPDECEINMDSTAPGAPFFCDPAIQTCDPDCNFNGIPDACDISSGTSEDKNGDGIPDECEDCNGNGIPDECEFDCGEPGGFCDVTGCGLGTDCDGNGNPDECDIDMDSSAPGGPFFCDPAIQTCDPDCNNTGIPDACDIASGTSDDLDFNGIPDECEEDCNLNGIVDAFDIANGSSEDCNANSIPDECDVAFRGPIVLSGHDADFGNSHCWNTPNACGDLYGALLSFAVDNSRVLPPEEARILAIGVNDRPTSDAARALDWFNDPINAGPGAELDFATTPAEIAAADFTQFSAVYIPSSSIPPLTEGGITQVQLDALNARQADLDGFVNFLGGGLVALTEAFLDNAYEWVPMPLVAQNQEHSAACPTAALSQIPGHTVGSCADLSPGGPYHTIFTGPSGFSGLSVLAVDDDPPDEEQDTILLGQLVFVSEFDCNGDGTIDECQCPTDVDGDGQTGAFDLAVLLGCWGPLPGTPQCNCLLDADGDGNIGPFDLAFLLGNWGSCQ